MTMTDAKKHPLLFPWIYRYYNAIVGLMMTISVKNSKRRALLFWGHKIYSKISSTGIGLRVVQKIEKIIAYQLFFYLVV